MFIDTSGLFCYHHRDEKQNDDAIEFFRNARTRLTHNYVLAEFVALTETRRIPRGPALAFASDILDSAEIETFWVDETLHRGALSLLQERHDKTYSLCDAVSFLLMRERGITEALTTDHHFQQEGFVRLLQP